MLIDAMHAEETRVAVVDGNRLIEFDYESKLRKQLKGSIFLAKVTRVEPSLQAAFVNFGGNRHGFLPFSEIHPDYFRIPVADREALIAAQRAEIEEALAAEEAALAAEEAALAAAEAAEENRAFTAEDTQAEVQVESGESSATGAASDAVEVVGGEGAFTPAGHEAAPEEGEEESTSEDTSEENDEDEGDDEDDDEEESASVESDEDTASVPQETEGEGAVAASEPSKFIDRAVAEINLETFEVTGYAEEPTELEYETALRVEELLKAREDVIRVRRHYRRGEDGVKKCVLFVAYAEDNQDIDHEQALAAEQEARDKRRSRGRGRFRGRNGRNNSGGGGGRGRGRSSRHPMQNRQVEVLGGEGVDSDQPYRPSLHRNYKIQEVIKRGQIMLIQVQKEERGNKGAAVTTYLSLPGRYCVLMPNSPRGGGVSRKIASFAERKRMREILSELDAPEGMSVILRTAGVERGSEEIKRDHDYLMRLWENIRDLTLQSSAPALIYEESNLVKRAVRDIYAADIEEIHVAGDNGFKQAKEFMKLLMPSSVKKVHHYKDEKYPLFHRYQVENQIAEIGEPVAHLKSGGYLVINPTEALVSIDVNSGRATKERHIEETALKTNLEAAEEVARQLRLRDLGGLVVIDFIDMEDHRNNSKVERRLRDALSTDRARIQVGRISSFGLLELSRQRLNPSLTEAQFQKCPHCQGVGHIRTVDSVAILALRSLEEEGTRSRAAQVYLSLPNEIAIYILNQKRDMLAEIERRYGFTVYIRVDESLAPSGYQLEAVRPDAVGQDDDEEGDETVRQSDFEGEAEAEPTQSSEVAEIADENGDAEQPREGGKGRGRGRDGRGRGDREPRDGGKGRGRGRDGRGRGRGGDKNAEMMADGTGENAAPENDNAVARENTPRTASSSESSVSSGASASSESGFRAKRFRARAPAAPAAEASSGTLQETAPVEFTETVTAAAPSNDVGPETDSASAPDKKKRGWWNKLTQK